jgi:hypothetical protein
MAKPDTHIVIKSKRDGYRRGGVAHPKGSTTYPVGNFTKDQVEAFKNDPRLEVKLTGEDAGGGQGDWPPTEEALAEMKHDALGEILTARGVDPVPLKSKDERRAAIRELVAKEKA